MENSKSILQTEIKRLNPNITEQTRIRYNQLLRKLYFNVLGTEKFNIRNFEIQDNKFLKYLNEQPATDRKRYLSALNSILPNNEKYNSIKTATSYEANEIYQTREASERDKEAMISQQEIQDKFKIYEAKAKKIYKKSVMDLTYEDYENLQAFIILSLSTLILPRRSQDLTEFKIRNIDKMKDNFLNRNKQIVYLSYKGANDKGMQIIDIPTKLNNILLKWIDINPTDYLLFSSNYKQITPAQLTKKINKIFDYRPIAINSIRKAYITETHGNDFYDATEKLQSIKNDMVKMGSGLGAIKHYIKDR